MRGFSLVELSIVLVILGLLVGGVLSGQSLIRAAELRAVASESSRYITAAHSFRDKYFALPGDMKNATAFWGKDNANCPGDIGTASTPGTCNGNGDGLIIMGTVIYGTAENTQFWKQLALAGLIEGTYSGLTGWIPSPGLAECPVGTSCPSSRLTPGGWGVLYQGVVSPNGINYGADYGTYMSFGAGGAAYIPIQPVLKPEEAWNIDTKVDDGKPATGSVLAANWSTCTTSTAATDTNGTYLVTSSNIGCSLDFVRVF